MDSLHHFAPLTTTDVVAIAGSAIFAIAAFFYSYTLQIAIPH